MIFFCFLSQYYSPVLPSCSNDSTSHEKVTKLFHQRMEPLHVLPSCSFLQWDRKLLHSNLHTLVSRDSPFLQHSLPSVPQDSEYIKTWPKSVSLQRCISSHQEVKGFCSEPNIHCENFTLNILYKHMGCPHTSGFEASPAEGGKKPGEG